MALKSYNRFEIKSFENTLEISGMFSSKKIYDNLSSGKQPTQGSKMNCLGSQY